MTRDHLTRFVQRDWSAIAEAKERDWLRRRGVSYGELLGRIDALRRHARLVAPSGPSTEDRCADADAHRRVGDALRAIIDTAR